MQLTYIVTVCNEDVEFVRLCDVLTKNVPVNDIIILADAKNISDGVSKEISARGLKHVYNDLDGNFARHRNRILSVVTDGWLLYLDADEIPSEGLLRDLGDITTALDEMGTYVAGIPRINNVDGLTDEYIKKWGWSTSMVTVDGITHADVVNFPDIQFRLHKCMPDIRWHGAVHERIIGSEFCTFLDYQEGYYLLHPKTIDKQIKQNTLYEKIANNVVL